MFDEIEPVFHVCSDPNRFWCRPNYVPIFSSTWIVFDKLHKFWRIWLDHDPWFCIQTRLMGFPLTFPYLFLCLVRFRIYFYFNVYFRNTLLHFWILINKLTTCSTSRLFLKYYGVFNLLICMMYRILTWLQNGWLAMVEDQELSFLKS